MPEIGAGVLIAVRGSGQMEIPFAGDCLQHTGTEGRLSGTPVIPPSNKELLQ